MAAVATLIGLLIDKEIIRPEEVISYLEQTTDNALTSGSPPEAAQASHAILEFVKQRSGVEGTKPS